ncbi:YCF48-related protein, partial [Methylobacterium crusticola]|uniref:YCF48-related protein n=1 Tax=Methylobacterium crusticola TaxID=1697972 RepID=UPI001EE158B2
MNTNEDFKAVYFTNLRNGWAVGDKGLIAITDDGGRHWTLQRNQAHTLLVDVFFLNSKTGWIAGQDGLLHTKNGGKTWH